MYNNPFNLAFRFLLELASLAAFAYWGWQTGEGGLRWLLAIGVPLVAATIWGVFRVPNDPGKAPVAVSGRTRLLIEATFFGLAVWGCGSSGRRSPACFLQQRS